MRYLILAATVVLLVSCNDEEISNTTTYSGIVYDLDTNKPIEGVNITIERADGLEQSRFDFDNPFDNRILWINSAFSEAITNSKGRYKIRVKDEDKIVYRVLAEKQGFGQDRDINIIGSSIQPEINNTDTLYMGVSSELEIHIRNQSTSNDSLSLTIASPIRFGESYGKIFVRSINFNERSADTTLTYNLIYKYYPEIGIFYTVKNENVLAELDTTLALTKGNKQRFYIDY